MKDAPRSKAGLALWLGVPAALLLLVVFGRNRTGGLNSLTLGSREKVAESEYDRYYSITPGFLARCVALCRR
jgi:hypothetical protein